MTVDDRSAAVIGAALTRLIRAAARAKAHDTATSGPFHTMAVLWALREHGTLRSNALADLCFTDPSTVSRQVAVLVQQGLVEREPDPDDRRAARLALTDRGRAFVEDRLSARDARLAGITADWSARDRAAFAALFDRFATDFAEHVSDLANLPTVHLPGEHVLAQVPAPPVPSTPERS